MNTENLEKALHSATFLIQDLKDIRVCGDAVESALAECLIEAAMNIKAKLESLL